jgi:hypothetical protein
MADVTATGLKISVLLPLFVLKITFYALIFYLA